MPACQSGHFVLIAALCYSLRGSIVHFAKWEGGMGVTERPRVVFIYGTREGLASGMARGLLAEKTAGICDILNRCEQLIRERLGWSLHEVCAAEQFALEELRPPSLTALQIALTEGWRERGVEPDAVAARSGGEHAAEYARGTLTVANAIEVACRVSCFIRERRGAGRMFLINLGLSETEHLRRAGPVPFYVLADVAE
jgi:acyl transferase domain-containing protein